MDIDLHSLSYLDAEITRYRDLEWKLASFHNAVLTAVFLLFSGTERQAELDFLKWPMVAAVCVYALQAIGHMLHAHRRLNQQRDRRRQLCEHISASPGRGGSWLLSIRHDRKPQLFDLYEGAPAWVVASIIVLITALATGDVLVILHSPLGEV